MIDHHSDTGSWAAILPYCTQIAIREHNSFAEQLERNLARRRAMRPKLSERALRGWETRRGR